MLAGCDVSMYQDANATPRRVDFRQMKAAGAEFVFIRAAFGVTPDEDFTYNWQAAKEAGLLRGAYCFYNYWPGAAKASKQISVWMDMLSQDSGEIYPAIDIECPNQAWRAAWDALTRDTALDAIWQFQNAVRETRLQRAKAIIYTNPAAIHERLKPAPSWLLDMPLWLAHWYVKVLDYEPWRDWAFWQEGLGKGRGLSMGVESLDIDIDYYNGDLPGLRAFCGLGEQQPEPEEMTVEQRLARLEAEARAHGWSV